MATSKSFRSFKDSNSSQESDRILGRRSFSIRSLMLSVVGWSVLAAIASAYYANHKWYNHDVANFQLESGHQIRVWTAWYWPGRDERMLCYEVYQNSTCIVPRTDLELSFNENTDQISIALSETGDDIAVFTGYGDRVLMLGDLKRNLFVSCFGLVCRGSMNGNDPPNWGFTLKQLRQTNPDLKLENWIFN